MLKPNKTILVYSIYIFLIIGLIYLILDDLKYKKISKNYLEAIQDSDDLNSKLLNRILLQSKFSKTYSLSDSTYVKDYLGQSIPLKNVLKKDSNYLIFRFSPTINCESCIESGLNYLKDLFDRKRGNSIILLISNVNDRELLIWGNKLGISIDTYQIMGSSLPSEIENTGLPYFFIINKRLNGEMFFVVENDLSSLTKEYLSIIETQL